MPILLNAVEARILGALIEKEATTPEYYPLSLNALVNACNQKNNREPVMTLDEDAVRQGLHGLESDKLAGPARGTESRVTKYEHHLQEVFNFTRAEIALLGALLLRGPQTPGELRGRTERLHRFEELSDVQAGLQRLMQRDPSLVAVLPRQPGTKEARYIHLLSGEIDMPEQQGDQGAGIAPRDSERLAQVENELAALRAEISQLRQELQELQELRSSHASSPNEDGEVPT